MFTVFTDIELMLIEKAKIIIQEVIYKHGIEKVKISFSGGKDSTVLKHLVESVNNNS